MASYDLDIYSHVKCFAFRMYEVEKNFNPKGALSEVTLALQDIRNEENQAFCVRLDQLIDFNQDLLGKPETRPEELKPSIKRLVPLLKECRKDCLKMPEDKNVLSPQLTSHTDRPSTSGASHNPQNCARHET